MNGRLIMISQAPYGAEPWCLTEASLDLNLLAQSESVFALSNGHIGLRGNLDEGEPHGLPGTYLNSLYEERPLPYAEAGYGFPAGRPDGHQRHQRQGDPAAGKRRAVRYPVRHAALAYEDPRPAGRNADSFGAWTSPAGDTVEIHSERLVSLTQRAIAAIRYTVKPVSGKLRVVVMSEIVANEEVPTGRRRSAGRVHARVAPGQRGAHGG